MASDILNEMKQALDEVQSYSIDEYFTLELSGDMSDGYARSSSELDYERTDDGFKAVGSERTDRDAGSNDKVTQYRIYAETKTTEEGKESGLLLETLASGSWASMDWLPETREALDHISRFYHLVGNAVRADYLDVDVFDGKPFHIIDYKLSPVDKRKCFDLLEQYSVPAELFGEEGLNDIMADTELIARLYIDEQTMLPSRLFIDLSPLQQAMLDQLNIDIEILKAECEIIIGDYDEIKVEIPKSAQSLYDNL